MGLEFVTVGRTQYYVINDTSDLSRQQIIDITKIKGLKHLTHLKHLNLSENEIKEIKGLDQLTHLETVDLRNNPIREEERHLIEVSAQEVVKYCQEKIGQKRLEKWF